MEPVIKILYGPPGTGKTWRAARDAVRLIDPDADDGVIAARHAELVTAGLIKWVTFHPSYAYEDFVEGLRPVRTPVGITYEPKPGPFKEACTSTTSPSRVKTFSVGQRLASTTGQEYEVVDYDSGAIVLKNLKGKGKDLLTPVSFWLVDRLVESQYVPGDLSIPGEQHPKKKEISFHLGVDMQTLFSMTGPLRTVWEYVNKTPPAKPTVLVIDEINRADTARVFGELITLLEPDKRIGAPEERRVLLPYSGELFGIPADLHLIGTMNTADRSLTLIDYALRRRFDFEEVPPDGSLCAAPYAGVDLGKVLLAWNERISAALNPDQRIGHSYLMEAQLERIRNDRGFSADPDGELRAVAFALRKRILPLLQEYFHDDWRMIDFVFGKNWGTDKGGLLTFRSLDYLDEAADELLDLGEASAYGMPDYWDPESTGWSAEEFRARLR